VTTSTPPSISEFVLYAERAVALGQHVKVDGGDIGVRSIASLSAGYQLVIGGDSEVEHCRQVFAQSIELRRGVRIGQMNANAITDDGVEIGPVFLFPATGMPALPLAPAPLTGGEDVYVAEGEVLVLLPGNYGSVTVLGRLELISGTYGFCELLVGDCAHVRATADRVLGVNPAGDGGEGNDEDRKPDLTQLSITKFLNAGRDTLIAPTEEHCAKRFLILVAGADTPGRPAVSIGERSRLSAIVAAPHGTVAIADHCKLTGAFAAFDFEVGERVDVEFEGGLPSAGPSQQGSQQLSGYYGVNPNLNVAPLSGPVPPDTLIDLAVGLPVRNPGALQTLIRQVSDPKSPNYRQHISQSQFTSTYGATAEDYQTLQDWATASGFTITSTYSNNLLLSVQATAEQIQSALFVNLVFRLRNDGSQFVAVDRDPSLNLAVPILEINGLSDFFVVRPASQNSTGPQGYLARDLRNAYLGVGSPFQSLDGTGQVVGILGLDAFNPSDISLYHASQFPAVGQSPIPNPQVTQVNSGGTPGLEATLDVSMVLAMAPNAEIFFFHGSTGITGHADDVLHQMATFSPPLSVGSCSWVFGRSDNSQQALDQMAAQGVSFFLASGDFGDVGDPQGNLDMNNQVLVGGTILNTNAVTGGGSSATYPSPYYAGENTWNQATKPQQQAVTGGGVMDGNNDAGGGAGEIIGIGSTSGAGNCYCWPYPECCGSGVGIPDYQVAVMQSSSASNGGSQTWRNYPDVAAIASDIQIFLAGVATSVLGTSAAAPLWAGFMALVNQNSEANGQGLGGFLNPTLYDIGLTRGTAVDLFSECFNNIADGGNNFDGFGPGFTSVAGYNLCTGWGSMTGALLSQLSTLNPLTPNQPLVLIQVSVTTGNDDAGGGLNGSSQSVTVFLKDGGSFDLNLRNSAEPNWGNWSTHTITFPIPATDSSGNPIPPLTTVSGISGIQVHLNQSNPGWSADNWDVFALRVALSTPGFPPVCQLCLIGDSTLQDGSAGLVRLSLSAGSSGNGPDSPVFNVPATPTEGTALTQIQFLVTTGNDDAGGGENGSSQAATVFVPGGGNFSVPLRSSSQPNWENYTTNVVTANIPATDSAGNPVPQFTPESGITGVQIDLQQNNPDWAADNWDVYALQVNLLSADGTVSVPQLCLVGTATLQDGSTGLVRLSNSAGGSGVGPTSQVFSTNPGSGCGD
jgi:Pro-kumamolisin, activation domain